MLLPYYVKRKLSLAMAGSPGLIHAIEAVKLRSKSAGHRIVGPDTKLVIEGPPRCGNSSALRLVTRNNPTYRRGVATHIHRSFQLYYAMQYNVPAVVMLRDPEDSTISHASLLCQLGQVTVENDRDRTLLLRLCVEEYLAFVRDIHRLGFTTICPFEYYVKRPESLIEYINQVYDLGLLSGAHVQDGDEAVHVFPSERRNTLKQSFSAAAQASPEITKLMQSARYYHDALISERVMPDER